MNESLCEACGFNHQTDTCRDQKALARWRERLAENAAQSALGKRIEARKRREIEAPLREEIEALRTALTRAEAEIAKLREAMPSEDALNGAIASVVIVESVSRKTGNPMIEPARDWLTRLEAARKEVG